MEKQCFGSSDEAATSPCYQLCSRALFNQCSAGAILEVFGWHSDCLVSVLVAKYADYSQWLPGEENGHIKLKFN